MTIQILNDFHGDGVFRDQTGTIWVRQSEMVEGTKSAWDSGYFTGLERNGYHGPDLNPYRAAKGEQK